MTLILLQAKLPDIYLDVPFEKTYFPIISQCLANSHELKLVPFIAGYLMNTFTKSCELAAKFRLVPISKTE